MKRWMSVIAAVVALAGMNVAVVSRAQEVASGATATNSAAARELVERAGAYLEAASIGATGMSGTERLNAAVVSKEGFTTTWREMNEAQRTAAAAFVERVLSAEWARRVNEMIAMSALATSERPLTLKITRAKGIADGWTWAVIGRDVTMEVTFTPERVVGMGTFTLMARGGRASMLADMDRAAMQLMHRLPSDLTQRAQWRDQHSGDTVPAPPMAGVSASEMNESQQRAFREVLAMGAGIMREDIATGASRALAGEGWKSARLVWCEVWHPSLPHAHRVSGEGFSVSVSMTPPKDEEEARARLEWRETW